MEGGYSQQWHRIGSKLEGGGGAIKKPNSQNHEINLKKKKMPLQKNNSKIIKFLILFKVYLGTIMLVPTPMVNKLKPSDPH